MLQHSKFSFFLFIFFLTATHHSRAKQGNDLIDSMVRTLPKQKEDTNKVKLLNQVSSAYGKTDPDEGIKYGQQALSLAEQLQWKKGIAKAYSSLGTNYNSKSDYSLAMESHTKALKIFEETGDKKNIAGAISDIGLVYRYLCDYPKALEYYFKALKMFEETGDKKGMASTIQHIATIYYKQGDYPLALEHDLKALTINEEIGNKSGMANVIENMASIYDEEGDFTKSLEYHAKALKIYEQLGDKLSVALVIGNIGECYESQNDHQKALEYFFKSLNMYRELGNKRGEARNLRNIGEVYGVLHDYKEAIANYFEALKMHHEIGNKKGEAEDLVSIGTDYMNIVSDTAKALPLPAIERSTVPGRSSELIPRSRNALLQKAVEYLSNGIAMLTEIRSLDKLQQSYRSLSTADSMLGDYKGAFMAQSKYIIYKDSVFSQSNSIKMAKLEMQKKATTDSLEHAQEKNIAALKYRQQRNYTYVGMAVAVLLLVFSFVVVRNNKLLGKEKKRSDDLLLNILPTEVAQELKENGSSKARQFDNVTVLFTDFVNFTQMSEQMSPQALIDELHTCFKTFDEITSKHNIEKVKTIGDAYLAACGLPAADAGHAVKVVRAALEIRDFMRKRYEQPGIRTFEMRIGIHSGNVVAGIVGVKKFAYDIWGDTVNTAARMEQNSEAGKINISERTYELVKDEFNCEYRGEIDVKNKGKMKMYWVNGTGVAG